MFYQFFRPLILLMRTNVYPRAIKRIADDLLALGDEFLNEVDAGIGIVVVFRAFDNTIQFAINGNSVYI